LIIDGKIRLAHGNVAEITENAVVLKDGTTLPADVIVYATGFGSMNGWAADLIGRHVADTVGKCWGLGSNTTKDPGPWVGEQRTCGRRPDRPACGSMAATCTSRAIIRSSCPCN
jgi:putative flavoprotein involved in K+ transport